MKSKHSLIITCLALAISGSANAASTVLLTDNFNSANSFDVNAAAATRQTGTLPSAWDGYDNDGDWQTQIENNYLLLTGDGNSGALMGGESLTSNYGAAAIGLLSMSFDLRRASSNNTTDWMSVSISNSAFGENPWILDAGVAFSVIFRANGNTNIEKGGGSATAWSSNTANFSMVTIVLSDTAGTGSAFNGNGSLARIYDASNTLIATSGALPQLTNAYFSLGGYSTTSAGTIWNVDNLNITTIPEPSAALLGGLGLLALLRRRR
jgi:hypothetical protein